MDAGCCHFDYAYVYQNEKEVGEGIQQEIKEGVVKQEDLFIISKLASQQRLFQAFLSRGQAGQDELFPTDDRDMSIPGNSDNSTNMGGQMSSIPHIQETLITYCQSKGIAVAAYCPLGSPDRPQFLATDLFSLCTAKPEDASILDDPRIREIAAKQNRTPAQIYSGLFLQVLLHFQIQRNVIAIPKSVTPQHILENFKVSDYE
ncbi:hypothetical protein Q9233_002556 [Columba guinea]|nr:hypothetical protein Q9233_002556 [Columba guinea]